MANEKEWQQDISTTVDAHTADLANHENRLNQAELNIADHEKRIDNIETTSDVGQFATRIQAVEQKNTEQDSAIDTLKKDVSDNLQTAKQYTDTKLTNYATKTENTNTLEQAKQYANSKSDDTLENAKQYSNTKANDTLELAKTDAAQKYFPLTGGALKNATITSGTLNSTVALYGGTNYSSGGSVILYGKDHANAPGAVRITAHDETRSSQLEISMNKISFMDKNVVRSVNNVDADENGNVNLTDYVKLASAQTISAQHNFSNGVKIGGYLITVG